MRRAEDGEDRNKDVGRRQVQAMKLYDMRMLLPLRICAIYGTDSDVWDVCQVSGRRTPFRCRSYTSGVNSCFANKVYRAIIEQTN